MKVKVLLSSILLLMSLTSCMTKTKLTPEDIAWLNSADVGDVFVFKSGEFTDTLFITESKYKNPQNLNPFDTEGRNYFVWGWEYIGTGTLHGYICNSRRYTSPLDALLCVTRQPGQDMPQIETAIGLAFLDSYDYNNDSYALVVETGSDTLVHKKNNFPKNMKEGPYSLISMEWSKRHGLLSYGITDSINTWLYRRDHYLGNVLDGGIPTPAKLDSVLLRHYPEVAEKFGITQ